MHTQKAETLVAKDNSLSPQDSKAVKSNKNTKNKKPNVVDEQKHSNTNEAKHTPMNAAIKKDMSAEAKILNDRQNVVHIHDMSTEALDDEVAHIESMLEAAIDEEKLMSLDSLEKMAKSQPKAPTSPNQSMKSTNVTSQSAINTESSGNKDKNKDSRKDRDTKSSNDKKPSLKVVESDEVKDSSNLKQAQGKALKEAATFEESITTLMDMDAEEATEIESSAFVQNKQKAKQKDSEESKEGKSQKILSSKQSAEITQTKETQRSQILYRSAQAKENLKSFAHLLREEVQNYKPPLTKLSMELNPRNLGALELTITKKGKDLHVQVVSNANALGLFLQNQVDFKNHLAQVGFDNVDLSFSSNDSDSGSGRESSGQNTSQNHAKHAKRNENSLEDVQNTEVSAMYITLPKYV